MSKLEEALLGQIMGAGLPAPRMEFSFTSTALFTKHKPPRPRAWRFDFAWDLYRLAVEVEGGIWTMGRHSRGKGYEQDCEKYAEAVLQGWRVIRVTGGMVTDGRALTLIQRALNQGRAQLCP